MNNETVDINKYRRKRKKIRMFQSNH